jgi:hypothetical protein
MQRTALQRDVSLRLSTLDNFPARKDAATVDRGLVGKPAENENPYKREKVGRLLGLFLRLRQLQEG